jgi:hypothetical protein
VSATRRWGAAVAFALGLALPARAGAQDFGAPVEPGAMGDLLERGLPSARADAALLALHVRRPLGLTTRALAARLGLRGVRAAVGLARTGDAGLGWSAGAAALGLGTDAGGAAIRGVLRVDDDAGPGEPRLGSELGGGAWVQWGSLTTWASAPQLRLVGVAPPLARGLSVGVSCDAGGGAVELIREAPRRGFAEAAAYAARAGLALGALSVWAEFRDHPWRGGLGLAAELGSVRCVAQVDSHPVLEPTTRLAITLRTAARRPR